ncbi:hypothetical protein M0Q28_05120 [Patescibacteria group bacterium]|jgi:hypothetical protein|nr:hypothetical protein [Patescibacteria group bacterium]
MSLEQIFANAGKSENRLEASQLPYQREELLSLLAERQKYVSEALESAQETAIPEDEAGRAAALGAKSARIRQLSEWSDALSSAIKKFSKPSKAELRDPATAGQVWISKDFQNRLDRIGQEEDEGRLAVENLYLKQREDERAETERSVKAKIGRGKKKEQIIGDEDVEMELEDQDIEPAQTKEEVIGDEDVEMELEGHDLEPLDLEKRKAKKSDRAERDAYVAKLAEKFAAEEDTQVEYEDPFGQLLAEKTRERASAMSGPDRERLRQAQMLEAMEDLEQLSVEALNRVSKLWNDLKGLKKRLSELRAQMTGGTPVEQGVLAAVEAAAHQLKEEGDAGMRDVLMIEKQIASLREELGSQEEAADQEISGPRIKVPRSRPAIKKSA